MCYMDYTAALCDQFHLQPWQVNNVISLLDEGNTIPFIARYRKEAHGTLDDQLLRDSANGWTICVPWKNAGRRSGNRSRN